MTRQETHDEPHEKRCLGKRRLAFGDKPEWHAQRGGQPGRLAHVQLRRVHAAGGGELPVEVVQEADQRHLQHRHGEVDAGADPPASAERDELSTACTLLAKNRSGRNSSGESHAAVSLPIAHALMNSDPCTTAAAVDWCGTRIGAGGWSRSTSFTTAFSFASTRGFATSSAMVHSSITDVVSVAAAIKS
uniref:Uncharacterized protein n=1 Tax=Oryza punctata TaxID=4537 RepID=A0A0E0M3R3_ORYPU